MSYLLAQVTAHHVLCHAVRLCHQLTAQVSIQRQPWWSLHWQTNGRKSIRTTMLVNYSNVGCLFLPFCMIIREWDWKDPSACSKPSVVYANNEYCAPLTQKKCFFFYMHYSSTTIERILIVKEMDIISMLAYNGIGLDWRKVSGSPPSRRGQSFLLEDLPKDKRSFLASFFGVLTKVGSSSSPQLYSSNVSSKSGFASELLKWLKLSSELYRLQFSFF